MTVKPGLTQVLPVTAVRQFLILDQRSFPFLGIHCGQSLRCCNDLRLTSVLQPVLRMGQCELYSAGLVNTV